MHPHNNRLLDALNHCIAACEHCATACLSEQDAKMMAGCIRLDRDCADICALTARLVARGSAYAAALLKECAEICNACAAECGKHAYMAHCKECAAACLRCEQACRVGLTA